MFPWHWPALPASLLLLSTISSALGAVSQSTSLGDCTSLHRACVKCQNQNTYVAGSLVTSRVCRACNTQQGWALVGQGSKMTCACLSGRFESNGACSRCVKGMVCPGGGSTPKACPAGLATIISGARSFEQCLTTGGYGRVVQKTATGQVVVSGELCRVGTYNAGGNSSPCQRCSPGTTTTGEGARSAKDCVAPAGFYMGGGAGVRCPRGTYTEGYNSAPACTPCRTGLTTASEGSSTAGGCKVAKAGFYLQEQQTQAPQRQGVQAAAAADYDSSAPVDALPTQYVAVPCPIGSYQDRETEATSCTPCPYGLSTQDVGADGVALCLAPPGMQLLPGAESVSNCPRGSYKEGWNNNLCTSCGEGLETESAGAVAADACYVPAGFGVEFDAANGTRSAVPCVQNTYGQSSPSFDLLTSRCIPCPEGTATPDVQSGVAAAAGYTSSQACMPLPGWGYTASGAVERCYVGSWSAGGAQRSCRACPAKFTTAAEGAVSSSECWVEPGWSVPGPSRLPQPCDKGSYSTGGSAAAPGGSCIACPVGFTTQEAASESADECNVCSPGYGGDACQPCSYGTYSYGGSAQGCKPCEAGQTSARGAKSSSQCVLTWPQEGDSSSTQVRVSDDSAWTVMTAGDASEQACKATCGPACIMYQYSSSEKKCQVLQELAPNAAEFSSRAAVGFKAFSGGVVLDYAFYYIPSSVELGVQIKDLGTVTMGECLKACSMSDACVLVRVTGNAERNSSSVNSCALFTGQLDADSMTSYQVAPQHLLSDGFVVNTL